MKNKAIREQRATNKGFSFIEALISLFILFLLVAFIIGVFPTIRKALQLSENHTYASYIGTSLLDDLRRNGFTNASSYSGSVNLSGLKNGNPFLQTINYSVNVQQPDTDKKSATATMSWRESTGNKQIILETILTNPGGG